MDCQTKTYFTEEGEDPGHYVQIGGDVEAAEVVVHSRNVVGHDRVQHAHVLADVRHIHPIEAHLAYRARARARVRVRACACACVCVCGSSEFSDGRK